MLKIGDPAPLCLTARALSSTVTPGGLLALELTATRREGFNEAVAVTLASSFTVARNNNNNGQNNNANAGPAVTIPKTATAATYPLTIPKNQAPGVYTVVLQGGGPFPFSKDPNAKSKPNVTLSEPSNPLTIVVRPAPATVAVNNKGGALKLGGSLEIEVTVTVKDATNPAPITVSLAAPSGLKLSADPVVATPGKPVKLVLKAAADSPAGAATGLAIRATVPVRGEPVDVNEPVTVNLSK